MDLATMFTIFVANFLIYDVGGNDRYSTNLKEGDVSNAIQTETTDINDYEKYPLIIPANLVIQICLKDTILPNKLEGNDECGEDYKCAFSKLIAHESLKSFVQLLRNEYTNKVDQDFKRAAHDCAIWWKILKKMNANLNGPNELAKCLFQTIALKCKEIVLDKVKDGLISKKKNLTY